MFRFYTLSFILLFHLLFGFNAATAVRGNVLPESAANSEVNPKVLFVGNSILAPVYNLFVNDGEPYQCTSLAFPGATIGDQVNAWQALSSDQKRSFDFILLEVGINNVFPGAESYISLYQDMVNIINAGKREDCIVIAATLTPSKGSDNVGFSNWLALNAAIRGEGPTPITGIGFVMTTNTTGLDLNGDYYMDAEFDRGDGVHPNSAGQQVIKNNFLEALEINSGGPIDPPADTVVNPPDPPDPPDTVVVLNPPQAPSLLKAERTAEKKIALTWEDDSDNESGFIISKSPVANPARSLSVNVNANVTGYTDNDVEPGTAYVYKIKAVNSDGSSVFSESAVASVFSSTEVKRTQNGLVAYYNFAFNPDFIIYDLSGTGEPVNLYADDYLSPQWDEHELVIRNEAYFSSMSAAEKITSAPSLTNELTVECWIKPAEDGNSGTTRILSLNENEDKIGFVLEQNKNSNEFSYSFRLNTSSTVSSGLPSLSQKESKTTSLGMHHIVFTRDSTGNEFIYEDGEKTAEGFRPGSLDVWESNFKLLLGNSVNGDHPWNGSIYLVAIYDRALFSDEVNRNYNAGPHEGVVKSSMDYSLEVGPNPASAYLNVKMSASEVPDIIISSALIRIIDINGNVLFNEDLFSPALEFQKTLDISGLYPGIYFLQVISGKKSQSTKFIKN